MLDFELHSAHVYLVFVAIILTISILSYMYPFLVTLYVVTEMVMGQNFDGSSKYCLEMPLL